MPLQMRERSFAMLCVDHLNASDLAEHQRANIVPVEMLLNFGDQSKIVAEFYCQRVIDWGQATCGKLDVDHGPPNPRHKSTVIHRADAGVVIYAIHGP